MPTCYLVTALHITALAPVLLRVVELAVIVRAVLRPHRDPASRIAWVVVISVVPVVGILLYLLVGETSIGRKARERAREVLASLPPFALKSKGDPEAERLGPHDHLFRTATSISGFPPVGGNTARLFSDSNASVDSLVADIDGARDHVHVLFYIWLTDNNGNRVAEALMRAAGRGVTCRAMVDAMGSRALIRSEQWKRLKKAGVHTAIALPIQRPVLRPRNRRIDLRNHRKIVVIDDGITYCGSQNCADPEFRVKPRFAPWVDAVIRFEGPIARQNQHIFASDWMTWVDEDLRGMLKTPVSADEDGILAQAFGTGPTARHSAMPEMFQSLMYAARREIVITTPYYVPDEAMQAGLCAAARRGVETRIIFPERNDSFEVGAASRSYYADLLEAGVKIHEYQGGLLHTKSFTVDGEITLIGSANMDRRSFDLNYENNILVRDQGLTAEVRHLQEQYLSRSRTVTAESVAGWRLSRRLWNNVLAMLGPVL